MAEVLSGTENSKVAICKTSAGLYQYRGVRLRDGAKVIWGSAEQSELKSQVLATLLPLGGDVFDVSAPGFPARR